MIASISHIAVLAAASLALATGERAGRRREAADELPLDVVEFQNERLILAPDLRRIERLRHRSALRAAPLVLPDGRLVELDLARIDLQGLRVGVSINGANAPAALERTALSLWSGTLRGEPDSSAFVAFSRVGCRGWIEFAGETYHLLARAAANGAWEASDVVLLPSRALTGASARSDPSCQGWLDATGGGAPELPPPNGAPGIVLECKLAIECDYQLFQRFNDAGAELAYVVALLGAVSSRYNEQLDVVLTYPYLNLWTVPGDPWLAQDAGGSSIDVLLEFRAAWQNNIPSGASLAQLLSGAATGGGAAYRDVLCNSADGFAVSGNLTHFGPTPFPVVQGPLNWDFDVVAHETGHNFSAIHTHEECPPLDQCAPLAYFGPCQSASVCTSQGTLMSYCQVCPGGLANITTYFHSAQLPGMRAAAETSCLTQYCASEIWVDASYSGAELGTQAQPFDTIVEGLAETCDAGTLWISASTYDEPTPFAIVQPVTLKSTGGAALIR